MEPRHSAVRALFFALVATVTLADVATPMSKVIELIRDLQAEVQEEGSHEAATYQQFADFCKTQTGLKSEGLVGGQANVEELSATIKEKTADSADKAADLKKRRKDLEQLHLDLKANTDQCAKYKAEWEVKDADLTKAISSLVKAIASLKSSRPVLFTQLQHALALGSAMGYLPESKHSSIVSMLQAKVDPDDPEYKFHSDGIIGVLEKLHKEFDDEKTSVSEEWEKTRGICEDTDLALNENIESNNNAIDGPTGLIASIATLKGEIAATRNNLVETQTLLQEDQLFLKDLTVRCEARARDWDQRSTMRKGELEALEQALDVLQGNVQEADTAVNKRALLERSSGKIERDVQPHSVPAAVSLLQVVSSDEGAGSKGNRQLRGGVGNEAKMRQKVEDVVTMLGKEGRRLNSVSLAALASRMSADPFGEVKTLIQKLIERLLAEATDEANKKGFCDQELGKAKKDRKFKMAEANKLDSEIIGLDLKKDELDQEIALMEKEIRELTAEKVEAEQDRDAEQEANLEAIQTAKHGLGNVTVAIDILKSFYKKASRARVFIQKASPVDMATDGPAFSGAYKGKQAQSEGVIGMLEVIKSDFDRTLRKTEASEKEAHATWKKFERAQLASIEGKDTKRKLDEEDLRETKDNIEKKMEDLQTTQKLLDNALKRLVELQPTCVDMHMTHAERMEKREAEIQALKVAHCQLLPEEDRAGPCV